MNSIRFEHAMTKITHLREQIATKDAALRKAEEALVSQGYASNGPTLIAVRAALTNTQEKSS
jgi:mannitol/fructose-specific phosphotransferase system IIA component